MKCKLVESKFGKKIRIWMDVKDPDFIASIKSFSWNESHRQWIPGEKCWEIDAEYGIKLADKLQVFGSRYSELIKQLKSCFDEFSNQTIAQRYKVRWIPDLETWTLDFYSDFNEEFVIFLKENGARWNRHKKCWSFDILDAHDLQEELVNYKDGSLAIPDPVLRVIESLNVNKPTVSIVIENKAKLYGIKKITKHGNFKKFKDYLRYNILGFKHPNERNIKRYTNGVYDDWDGYVPLYRYDWDEDKLIFDVGAVQLVRKFLEKEGFKVVVDDRRIVRKIEDGRIRCKIRWSKLRKPQKEMVPRILETLKEHGTTMYSLPTGLGKTVLDLYIVSILKVPTVILVHTKDLMYQWAQEIKEWLGYDAGIVGDGKYKPKDITVATLQSLYAWLERESKKYQLDDLAENTKDVDEQVQRFIDTGGIQEQDIVEGVHPAFFKQFSLVIFDEIHVGAANTYLKVLRSFTARYFIGNSATTFRTDRMHPLLKGIFREPCNVYTNAQGVEDGYLVPVHVNCIKMEYEGNLPSNHRAQERYIKENETRNKLIAKIVKECPKPVLIFTRQVSHQRYIMQALKDENLDGKILYANGKTSSAKRVAIREKMRRERIDGVCITPIWTAGIDIPAIRTIILAFPMKSPVSVIQLIGRGQRIHQNKDVLVVYDIVDGLHYLLKRYLSRLKTYEDLGWTVHQRTETICVPPDIEDY